MTKSEIANFASIWLIYQLNSYGKFIRKENRIIHAVKYISITGSLLSATFDKMETAALISVPFDLIGLMFSGIYLNLTSASPYFSWLRYISAFYYGTESISILQWDLVDTIDCAGVVNTPCIRTGPDVLTRFAFQESHFWRNCFCLIFMYFIGNFIAFVMVVKRSRGTAVY